jgi:hypothetical protein
VYLGLSFLATMIDAIFYSTTDDRFVKPGSCQCQ